jgi:hypothetical protein
VAAEQKLIPRSNIPLPSDEIAADFVIVARGRNSVTTFVKRNSFARFLAGAACLGALTLLTGCFETKGEFTVNPDGSGKVVHECTFQEVKLGNDTEPTEDSLKEAIGKVITEAKGVEAWRDVSYKRLDDGRLFFKGTAYFTNLNTLDIPNQTMLEFDWKKAGASAVLTLRTNKSEKKEGFQVKKEAVDWSKLTPDERAKKLKEERAKFQQAKGMMGAFMGSMKHETIFHLPGKVGESLNFTKDASGALRLQFEGAKLLAAMEKLIADDAWATKNYGSLGGQEKPMMDDAVNELVFGSKAPVRATLSGGQPLFNYATEVALAKKEMAQLRQKLGVGSAVVTVAAPAQGGALRGVKVVGARWISKLDRKEDDFRPFFHEPGYTLVLQADFPGSILAVTSSSIATKATADDGSDLLPNQDRIRWTSDVKLSADQGSALIEVELKLPAPGVKGLRELSGTIEYQVAGGTQQVDLGFTNLQANARGAELGAQIKSIKPGWRNDGSQQLELKLNHPKNGLKAVYLKLDATNLSKLAQRGYSSGGNSYTYTFDHTGPIPANGRLVVEIYEQLQTFTAPFKLENISLLGTPLNTK